MGRRTLLLIASILVAALGTTLVWLYVQGADSRAQQGARLVSVLFLNGDAAADATPEALAGLVVQKNVPADVAAGALTSLGQVQGKVLLDTAVKGQILLPSMFGTTPSSGIADNRAFVSISIAEPDRVPALLKAGDDVAVYARGNSAGGRTTALIARRVTVMTLGNTTKAGPNGKAVAVTNVGFDVDPQLGVNLINIANYGTPVLELLGKNTVAEPSPKP